MKKLLAAILVLCMVFGMVPIRASAEGTKVADGTCGDNLTWVLDSSGEMTISGTGGMEDYFVFDVAGMQDLSPWWDYRGQITSLVIEEGVTNVGGYSFYECAALRSISLPSTLSSIDHYAFGYCVSLSQVTVPEGVTTLYDFAFGECTGLIKITLPESLRSIYRRAFLNCTALETVTLPKNVRSVDGSAFSGCRSLTAIQVASGNENFVSDSRGVLYNADKTKLIVAPGGIYGSYTIPATVDTINDSAFYNCVSLTEVVISQGVQTIGYEAFSGCSNLQKVTIPVGITEIPTNAFCLCERLTAVVIPHGVTKIDSSAFNACFALETVVLPSTVTEIGNNAFSRGDSLTQIYYTGTAAKWNAITIGTGNEDVTAAKKSYNTHDNHSFTASKVSPKCNKTGYTTYTCTCGISYVADYTPVRGHNYQATVGSNGYIAYDCSRCSSTYTSNYPEHLPVVTSNRNDQDYSKWAEVVRSYLVQNPDGTYTRVEFYGSRVHVEQYDKNLNFLSHAEIQPELPIFGGYYTNGENHFLVFGQENDAEDDHREVIRVVKYNSSWKRQGSSSLYGFYTTMPFWVGSLQMASHNDTLYVRTCHKRYTSEDGLRHQAGVMLTLRISDMTMLSTENIAYVSHCFNQLATMDGANLIMADHGDAYPRALQLAKDRMAIDVLTFADPGSYHYNYTGASIGGLAVSKTNYLVAGNSILQDGTVSMGGQRNIFITATSKSNFSQNGTKLIWLTKHSSGVTVSTPHMVKVSDTSFCVLWTENGVLHYTFVNASGKKTTEIFENSKGKISDCAPIYADGKIIWYVCDNAEMNFYTISPQKPETVSVQNVIGGTFKATASNAASTGKIQLSWNLVNGAVKYKVYRSTDQENWTLLKTLSGTSLTDISADAGTLYYYHVAAVSQSDAEIQRSSTVSRTCDLPSPDVSLSNVASSGKINIKWEPIEGAVKYKVYRSTDKENWTLLKTITSTSLTHGSTTAGELYYYKVKAIASNSAADSAYSAVKSRFCDLPRPVVTLSNVASSGKINIKWEPIEGAVKYKVYRSTDKENWTLLKTTTSTSLTHGSTTAGELYYYKVKAIASNSAADSAYSAVESRRCDLPRPVVTLSNVASSGKIKISWEAVEGAVKYKVYRSTDKENWTLLKTTTGTSLINTSTEAGTLYYYKVKAIASNSEANSAYSSVKSRTCDLPCPVVALDNSTAGKIEISWEAVEGAVKYKAYRSTDGESWTLLKTTADTKLTNADLTSGTVYYYKVLAIASISSANSAYSTVKSVKAG